MRRQLQTDQDEDQAVQHEHHHLPEHVDVEPRPSGENLRSAPAEKQSGGNHRQDARDMQALRRNVSGKRREERNGHLNGRIVETALNMGGKPANRQPDTGAAQGNPKKRPIASGSENVPLIIAAIPKR